MRVNIEDDLILSGRLSKFARAIGWDEDKALGRLTFIYRATQAALIVRASRTEIIDCIIDRCADEVEAGTCLDCMVKARLATSLDADSLHIRGNEKHVERLKEMSATAVAGGKARAKSASRDPAGRLVSSSRNPAAGWSAGPAVQQTPALLAPSSLLLTPTVCVDLNAPERPAIMATIAAGISLPAEGTHTPKPYGDLEREPEKPPRMRVDPMKLHALESENAEAMVKLGRPRPTRWGGQQKDHAADIMLLRPDDYGAVFANFRADARPYYAKIRWQPSALLRDIDQHTGPAPKMVSAVVRITYVEPEPVSEEQRNKSTAAMKEALKGII